MINGVVASHPSVYEKVGQMLRVPSGPSDLYVKVVLLGAGMGEIISTPSSLFVFALIAKRKLGICHCSSSVIRLLGFQVTSPMKITQLN